MLPKMTSTKPKRLKKPLSLCFKHQRFHNFEVKSAKKLSHTWALRETAVTLQPCLKWKALRIYQCDLQEDSNPKFIGQMKTRTGGELFHCPGCDTGLLLKEWVKAF